MPRPEPQIQVRQNHIGPCIDYRTHDAIHSKATPHRFGKHIRRSARAQLCGAAFYIFCLLTRYRCLPRYCRRDLSSWYGKTHRAARPAARRCARRNSRAAPAKGLPADARWYSRRSKKAPPSSRARARRTARLLPRPSATREGAISSCA